MTCEHGKQLTRAKIECAKKALTVHRGVCSRCPEFRGPWPEFLAVLDNIQKRPCPKPNREES